MKVMQPSSRQQEVKIERRGECGYPSQVGMGPTELWSEGEDEEQAGSRKPHRHRDCVAPAGAGKVVYLFVRLTRQTRQRPDLFHVVAAEQSLP